MAGLQTIQIIGVVGVLSYAVARFAARSGWFRYHRFSLLAIPRTGMPAMPRNYRVCRLSAADLADHVIDIGPDIQASRFAQGLECLGCFTPSGELAGVIWLGRSHHIDDDVALQFSFDDDCCWDTGLWIAPEYRIGRAFPALWAGVAEWMGNHGYDWSVGRIADYNIGSLLPHRRLNARELGSVAVFRFGRWQFCWPASPRWVAADRDVARLVISPASGPSGSTGPVRDDPASVNHAIG